MQFGSRDGRDARGYYENDGILKKTGGKGRLCGC